MDLLGKVRALVGALVHRPFAPRPGSVQVPPAGAEHAAAQMEHREEHRSTQGSLEREAAPTPESDRVADLIERQKRNPAG
jgi:hypothetical protein